MNGFIIILSIEKSIPLDIPVYWKKPFDFQSKFIQRKLKSHNYQIEQFSSQKFENEKLWIETADFIFITEGVIHNIGELCKKNNSIDAKSLITKYYQTNNNIFFNQFEGNYAGFLYNKHDNSLVVFNNKTGMKKIFYFQNSNYIIFASDLKTLCHSLAQLNISYSLDVESAYLLLTSGFMHENRTLINEIKQVRAGEYCLYKNSIIQIHSYFNLKNISETSDSKKTIIENLDGLFTEAVRLEFEIDKSNGLKHLTTLSGGLDSRMTALISYKIGYKDQILLNFSKKDYADEVIAKQIAKRFQMTFVQKELDERSLIAIDDVVSVNDGLTLYSACSHAYDALKRTKHSETGIIHTGMIGDAVMGSFVSKLNPTNPNIYSGLYSTGLINKAANTIKQSISNYPNDELYKFYNRAFLGANNGFLYFDLIGESSSPFLNSSFLSYAFSIPRKYKYKENIYIDWIKTLHPEIAHFTWESIGGKPTNNNYLRSIYRYRRAIIKRLPVKTMWKNNMNPEQLWYDKNSNIKQALDSYFHKYIELLYDHKELKDDLIRLYQIGNITEKTQALTLVSAYKLLFNE